MIIGLLAAQRLGLSGSGSAVQGALTKLDRLLPDSQRAQVQAMQDFVSLGLSPVARDHADAATILRLGTAARDRTRIRLTYRSAAGEETKRLVDPYGVAFQGGHWYLVSWDHYRSAMRTFRLDRMLATEVTSETFDRPEDFDVVAYLHQALGEAVYGTRCEVLLSLTLEEAKRRVSPTEGTLVAGETGTVFSFSADDFDWAAAYLAGLECDLVVMRPPELRASLSTLARRLQAAARGAKRRRAGAAAR
ncbi:MAG: helix-turn-helix transcriptional regulator [Acidimicrobiales bacterium]